VLGRKRPQRGPTFIIEPKGVDHGGQPTSDATRHGQIEKRERVGRSLEVVLTLTGESS
jgi:hypothetical protein